MVLEKISVKNKKRKLNLIVNKCTFFGKIRGLMFRRRENAKILLFEFKKPKRYAIHSFFVFFPFLVIWLDDRNNVLEWTLVYPWKFRVSPRKKFYKIVEIPKNKKFLPIIKLLVGD